MLKLVEDIEASPYETRLFAWTSMTISVLRRRLLPTHTTVHTYAFLPATMGNLSFVISIPPKPTYNGIELWPATMLLRV